MMILSLAGFGRAAAATYYVSAQSGIDSNPGTASAPFRSFSRATAMVAPGDTLIVVGGHYSEPLIVAKSGTAQKPIAVVGKDRPLIEAPGDAIQISGSYVEVSGFAAHALGEGSAISVGQRNHNVVVSNNVVSDSGCAGVALIGTDYVTIENNKVFGNARRSPWQCSGVSIFQPVNFDHGDGIHNVIRRNMVYDNMNVVVDDKISHSNGKTTDGNGIIVDDTRHTESKLNGPPYVGMTLIENNIVFDNGGRCINVFLSDDVIVRNNTCFHDLKDANLASRQAQGELAAAYAGDVKFVNNIAVPRADNFAGFSSFDTKDVSWDYNLIDGGLTLEPTAALPGWGAHNIAEAAGVNFVAASVDSNVADFRLRPDSRAIGAGSVPDAPSQDFLGALRPRSGPIDLGALQSSGTPDPPKPDERVR
jgi:parallel beta-helix repeat protein